MEKLLNDQIVKQINDMFADIKEPVQVLYFGSEKNCETCADTKQLLEEVTALSDRLDLSVYDIDRDQATAAQYNVTNTPAIVIAAKDGSTVTDLGVQYTGIPAGHEFGVFINDILMVSKRDSGLSQKTREFLKNLNKPLHLQVFVTPT
jgi:glutaredoxin-like protein